MATPTIVTYTNQQQVESYLDRPLSDYESAIFETIEGACEDIIDGYCARTFSVSRANRSNIDPTTGDGSSNPFQRYDGGATELFFDQPLQTDLTQSGVITPYTGYLDISTNQFTLIPVADYQFYPLNGKTKTSVLRILGVFPYGAASIFVYGTFADYLTPPTGITTAATIMAADIINLPDGIKSETIEGYSRTFSEDWNPTITKILDIFRRVVL